jgi:hypothetical protein
MVVTIVQRMKYVAQRMKLITPRVTSVRSVGDFSSSEASIRIFPRRKLVALRVTFAVHSVTFTT